MVQVFYIATGSYIDYISQFLKTLHYFLPEERKKVTILTDFIDECIIPKDMPSEIEWEMKYLRHYPWPINALFKMNYMYEHLDTNCTDVFYFNANTFFNKPVTRELFSVDKLNVVKHYEWPFEPKASCYLKPEDDLDTTTAYIGTTDYTYIQSGFFGGNIMSVRMMLESVASMLGTDLSHNIIPKWHDESYLNKYVYVNPDLVNVLPDHFMSMYYVEEKGHPVYCLLRDSEHTEKLKVNDRVY